MRKETASQRLTSSWEGTYTSGSETEGIVRSVSTYRTEALRCELPQTPFLQLSGENTGELSKFVDTRDAKPMPRSKTPPMAEGFFLPGVSLRTCPRKRKANAFQGHDYGIG